MHLRVRIDAGLEATDFAVIYAEPAVFGGRDRTVSRAETTYRYVDEPKEARSLRNRRTQLMHGKMLILLAARLSSEGWRGTAVRTSCPQRVSHTPRARP